MALKGILLQAKDIFQIWSVSQSDGLIWLATYFTVIIVEIEYGLLVGVVISVLILIAKGARGEICLLGRVPNTEVYLDVNTEPTVKNSQFYYCKQYNKATIITLKTICVIQLEIKEHLLDVCIKLAIKENPLLSNTWKKSKFV